VKDMLREEPQEKLNGLDPILEETLLKMAKNPDYINEIEQNTIAYEMLKAYLLRRGIRQGYPQKETKMTYKRREVVLPIEYIQEEERRYPA
jgi:hypothetical protein